MFSWINTPKWIYWVWKTGVEKFKEEKLLKKTIFNKWKKLISLMFHTNAGRFLWFDIRAVYAVTYIGTIGVGTNNVVYKFTFVCVWWSALIFIWKKFTNNKALFTLKK